MHLEAVLFRKIQTHSESFFLLINSNISGYSGTTNMHRLAKMFSLKIDLHCHIVMEHHFRIPGIPSSEVKKLSQGVADITASHKGGWCVCVCVCVCERETERERERVLGHS